MKIVIVWDDDLEGCCGCGGAVWMVAWGLGGENLDVLLMEGEKRRCGVEIGGDTAAVLTDLGFGFLMMHLRVYITTT